MFSDNPSKVGKCSLEQTANGTLLKDKCPGISLYRDLTKMRVTGSNQRRVPGRKTGPIKALTK